MPPSSLHHVVLFHLFSSCLPNTEEQIIFSFCIFIDPETDDKSATFKTLMILNRNLSILMRDNVESSCFLEFAHHRIIENSASSKISSWKFLISQLEVFILPPSGEHLIFSNLQLAFCSVPNKYWVFPFLPHADVVYDPEVTLALIGVLQKFSSSRADRKPDIYVALTVRNADTYHVFQAELGRCLFHSLHQ